MARAKKKRVPAKGDPHMMAMPMNHEGMMYGAGRGRKTTRHPMQPGGPRRKGRKY